LRSSVSGASIFAVLLIGVLWGLNWPAVKFMLTEIEPLTIRAVAFTLAALGLAAIVRTKGLPIRPPRDEVWPIFIAGFFLVFGFNAMTSLGQILVETSKAAIIAYTMPALTAGLAAGFLGERFYKRVAIALAVGMAALLVLASENFSAIIREPLGPVIMLLAALSWSIGNVLLKTRTWTLPALSQAVWYFVASGLVCWPIVLVLEPPWHQAIPSAPVMATMAFHVLGPMIVCYVLWTVLLARLPATIAAISTLIAPVVAVGSAMVLLDDPPSWQKYTALAMIVASVAVTLIRPSKET
jgi:drug/metabolite transporter (DMT)-like permease